MGRSNRLTAVRCTWLVLFSLSIAGCSLPKIKNSLTTGAATSAAVGVTSVLSPGVIAPAIAGGVTAAVATALTAEPEIKGEPIQAETVIQEAPDNIWTILDKLTSMAGWFLILVILIPMVIGWILPGPTKLNRK